MNVGDKFLLYCATGFPTEHTVTNITTYNNKPTAYWYSPACVCEHRVVTEGALGLLPPRGETQ